MTEARKFFDPKIAEVAAKFPEEFGLRSFPGEVFRISTSASYLGDKQQPMLYTERNLGADRWADFSKGTEEELRRQVVELPKK
jgi:hypothetical protein